ISMSESVPPAGASRPGKPGAHYDLFISYTTNPDARLAKSLKVFIERFHLLKTPERASLRELNVCLDSENFVEPGGESRPGTKLSAILQKHLEDSALILILCSRSTRISTGMKQEFDLLEKAQRLKDVILAVTDGENPRIPEGMFPRWILDANLDKSIWYDFREYRHAKNPKVLSKKSFNAERVRLACQLNGS